MNENDGYGRYDFGHPRYNPYVLPDIDEIFNVSSRSGHHITSYIGQIIVFKDMEGLLISPLSRGIREQRLDARKVNEILHSTDIYQITKIEK